jgi:hypothetical protein
MRANNESPIEPTSTAYPSPVPAAAAARLGAGVPALVDHGRSVAGALWRLGVCCQHRRRRGESRSFQDTGWAMAFMNGLYKSSGGQISDASDTFPARSVL